MSSGALQNTSLCNNVTYGEQDQAPPHETSLKFKRVETTQNVNHNGIKPGNGEKLHRCGQTNTNTLRRQRQDPDVNGLATLAQ